MNVRFFSPGKAYERIRDEVLPEIDRVLTAGDLILREDVETFEKNLAEYCGVKYAVSVANGTDAIELTLRALGIGKGHKVLAPSYTFRATVEAIHHAGATPVLYDLDGPKSFDKILAWIPAHIAGERCATKEQYRMAKEAGVIIIEDTAQAIGLPLKGHAGTLSFYPAKILGCYGDAGAVITNDKELANTLRLMRNHWKDDWKPFGFNSRLDNLQAAVLNVKIRHLPADIARRKEIAQMYDTALQGMVELPTKRDIYQDYIIATDSRDELYEYLKVYGVETMKNGYPFPAKLKKGKLTQAYESRSLRLPCNPELTDEEVEHVIMTIKAFYE